MITSFDINTKLIMAGSAIVLGIAGLVLTFAPDLIAPHIGLASDKTSQLLLQIVGALYFAFAMLNWMAKGSIIGGIYNRPIAIANVTHCVIAGLAILKGSGNLPPVFLAAGIIYIILALCFLAILFRHPGKNPSQ